MITLFAKRKNGRFSVIPARTIVILGHFFDGPNNSTKFRWKQSKIKGTYTYEPTQAQKGQKQGWALKNYQMTPTLIQIEQDDVILNLLFSKL